MGFSLKKIFKKPGAVIGPMMGQIPVVGEAISGAFAGYGAQSAADKEWERARDASKDAMAFSERMSSTAHMRAMQDLKNAGLNPILAAGDSASSPSGVMTAVPDVANAAGESVSTAREMRRLRKEIESMSSQVELNEQLKQESKAGGFLKIEQANKVNADAFKTKLENKVIQWVLDYMEKRGINRNIKKAGDMSPGKLLEHLIGISQSSAKEGK